MRSLQRLNASVGSDAILAASVDERGMSSAARVETGGMSTVKRGMPAGIANPKATLSPVALLYGVSEKERQLASETLTQGH